MQTKITPIVENERITYPCFMHVDRGNNENYVVLFLEYRSGYVVAAEENSMHKVGYRCLTWLMESFKPFKGTIEIS